MQTDLFNNITHLSERSHSGDEILQANFKRLSKQNNKLLEFIMAGNKANILNSHTIGVHTLHSRVADIRSWLKKNFNIDLNKATVRDSGMTYYNYFLNEQDINKLKSKMI